MIEEEVAVTVFIDQRWTSRGVTPPPPRYGTVMVYDKI
jgi:hypothetical protein